MLVFNGTVVVLICVGICLQRGDFNLDYVHHCSSLKNLPAHNSTIPLKCCLVGKWVRPGKGVTAVMTSNRRGITHTHKKKNPELQLFACYNSALLHSG